MSTTDTGSGLALRLQYETTYAERDARFAAWREIGGRVKCGRILQVLPRGISVDSLVEIGCGDGALLAEMARTGIARRLHGYEIAESAVAAAKARGVPSLEDVRLFDGLHLPEPDLRFDIAVLSHVLEHVPDPPALLREAGRVARTVVFEVPLEDTLLSRRESYRRAAQRIGHVQKLGLAAARSIVHAAGMDIEADLLSSKTREGRRFWAQTAAQKLRADLLHATARTLHVVAPPVSRRLLTTDYTCCCAVRR